VVKFAKENTSWGYDRIQGALANLGHSISDQSIGNILKDHGIDPAPERKASTSWSTFVKAHGEVLSAIDFTTIEVWTRQGLTTFYLLFAIELKSRRVCLAGCTTNPIEPWMLQIARNLTDCEDGFLREAKYLLLDRDAIFRRNFRNNLESAGVKPLRLPARTPNLNAWIERFHRTIKSECLERMIFFGEDSLRAAIGQFLEHYHTESNHQGLENRLIKPDKTSLLRDGPVQCRDRLGGILRYYHRTAA
jgi:putative transposase